jgi:hypothetical protein
VDPVKVIAVLLGGAADGERYEIPAHTLGFRIMPVMHEIGLTPLEDPDAVPFQTVDYFDSGRRKRYNIGSEEIEERQFVLEGLKLI